LALFIVHDIQVSQGPDGAPRIRGGHLRIIYPWKIEDGTLTAVGFEYAVPQRRTTMPRRFQQST
jgi:hypothetical protein